MSETKNSNPHGVKVGDIWEDCDARMTKRHLLVKEIAGDKATVVEVSKVTRREVGRKVKIRLDRFKPTSTGYRRITKGVSS